MMTRFGIILMTIAILLGGMYIRGYRIITLEEIPNSHRPGQLFLSADYGSKHFTQEENWLDVAQGK